MILCVFWSQKRFNLHIEDSFSVDANSIHNFSVTVAAAKKQFKVPSKQKKKPPKRKVFVNGISLGWDLVTFLLVGLLVILCACSWDAVLEKL